MDSKSLGEPSDTNPWISPKDRADDWRKLDLADPNSADWEAAVTIFSNRIEGRFLAPIRAIAKHTDNTISDFSGFTIIAIDCLLIETLYQFYKGKESTDVKHADAFWFFFENSIFFNKYFDSKNKAEIFYGHFRCGILHQAQTKKLSKIRIGRPSMLEQSNPKNIEDGFIIDRKQFHQALEDEIDTYKRQLKNPKTALDFDRRAKFVLKMAFIVK